MFADTIRQFRSMRASLHALVYVYWIQAFTGSVIGVFTQIFLYQKFTSITLNILATILFYTGIMLGFCVPGFLAAKYQLNLKQGFLWSFIISSAALFSFLFVTTTTEAYSAMLLWGFGQGIFWLTVNTFELSETKRLERDFYSSVLNAGNQVLSLLGPACATILIWLSGSVLHFGTFTLLFTIAPAIYCLGFFCFAYLADYRPKPILWADVRHFFTDRKNQAAHLYTFGTGVQQMLGVSVPPLVMLLILGSALRVGLFDTVFALFSAVCLLVIARYRTDTNRVLLYGVTTLGIFGVTVWYGYAFTFVALVIYTVVQAVLSPIQHVSSHVVDLDSMDIGKEGSDFYATMLLRDFFLWIWRCLAGLLFLCVIFVFGDTHATLSAGLYMLAAALLVTFIGAWSIISLQRRARV